MAETKTCRSSTDQVVVSLKQRLRMQRGRILSPIKINKYNDFLIQRATGCNYRIPVGTPLQARSGQATNLRAIPPYRLPPFHGGCVNHWGSILPGPLSSSRVTGLPPGERTSPAWGHASFLPPGRNQCVNRKARNAPSMLRALSQLSRNQERDSMRARSRMSGIASTLIQGPVGEAPP